MRVSQTAYINRSVDDVFAFLAVHGSDLESDGKAASGRATPAAPDGLGARLREAIAYQGHTADVNLEVTELEPDHRICFRAHGGVRAHGCYDVRADGPGTLLTASVTIELKGDEMMLERYVRQAVEQATDADLQSMKAVLESPVADRRDAGM